MAAPYVAGVAALYIGLNGGRGAHGPGLARELSQRIISSGNNVKAWEFEDEHFAPPPQVGTGLIDAGKVIGYTTSIDFDPFALNDTANFVALHNLTLSNGGDETVVYEFTVEAADGFDVFQENDGTSMWPRIKTLYELEPVAMPVDVDLPASLTLGPGESELVSFNFHKPSFEGYTLPMYSGKVIIKSSKNETLSVPYLGLAADSQDEMSDMFMHDSPEGIKVLGWQSIHDNASWTNNVWGVDEDWLYTTVQLRWATRELRWDIYEAGWNDSAWSYPPALGDDGYVGSVAYWRQSATRWWSQFSYDADPTDSEPFPLYDLNRNAVWGQYRNTFQWFGMLANGSQLEPGNYTMRLAALKPFGDPKVSEDWSIWNVPEISILGKFGPNPWSPGK